MGGGDYGDNCFNHRTDADGADDENVNKDDVGDATDGSSFVRLSLPDF